MFAKVLNSARRILSRSPSAQGRPSESREATPRHPDADADLDMVTTRSGQTGEGTPLSAARKGKRALDAEETPASSRKRRRSLGVKEQADHAGEAALEQAKESEPDTIEVLSKTELAKRASSKGEKLPIRRRSSPKVVVPKKPSPLPAVEQASAEAAPEETPLSTQDKVHDTPGTQQSSSMPRGAVGSTPTPKAKSEGDRTPKSSTKSEKRNKKKTKKTNGSIPVAIPSESRFPDEIPSSTFESDMATIPSQELAPASSAQAEKGHIRFDSEEPTESQGPLIINEQGHVRYGPSQELQPALQDGEDNESDSDEAPEVVTTASALQTAKAAEADAVNAHKAQQEREKLKRKERAARIAQEQALKRKREEKKVKKLAKLQTQQGPNEPPKAALGVDIHNLPALLPDSLLEAAGDQRPPTPPAVDFEKSAKDTRKEKLNHHIKFLERGEKSIKDVKKGSVNVHVLAQQNMLLAPKVNRDTKNIREHWLKGRQVEKKSKNGRRKMEFRKMERRSFGGGFLRGED